MRRLALYLAGLLAVAFPASVLLIAAELGRHQLVNDDDLSIGASLTAYGVALVPLLVLICRSGSSGRRT